MEHILPPVTLDDRLPWWSVHVDLPQEIDQEIRRYVEEDELTSWTLMIHGALYIYRTLFWTREQLRAELESMIEEGCRSAEQDGGREVTPAFWEEFRHKAERDAERLDQLQAAGKVGNLLLPRELYEFVKERIAAGDCNTPTEVVCAAVPYLRREHEESKKHGEGVADVP
jgi:Arc/MetJ-type ribon-helix-helix transcriptional regulator